MPSSRNKDPMGNLMDKLRSHFDFSGHPKNSSELPSRARFSIWHVLFAMLLFSCLEAISKKPK